MRTLITVENLRGAVLATDAPMTVFPLGANATVALAIANPGAFSIDFWKQVLDRFNTTLTDNPPSSTLRSYLDAFSQYVTDDKDLKEANYEGTFEIVFAGYGSEDIFPSYLYCSFSFDKGSLKGETLQSGSVDFDKQSWIRAYGNCEEIDSFLSGIADSLESTFVQKYTECAVLLKERLLKAIQAAGGKRKAQALVKQLDIDVLTENYRNRLKDYKLDHYVQSLNIGVAGFNMDELIKMCEDLVNLAGIQRHFRERQEAIDKTKELAILTRAEGFVWIKKMED